MQVEVRQTVHQAAVARGNKERRREAYEEVHKAATLEADAARAAGKLGRHGITLAAIAEKHDQRLSSGNPHRITERALQAWHERQQ